MRVAIVPGGECDRLLGVLNRLARRTRLDVRQLRGIDPVEEGAHRRHFRMVDDHTDRVARSRDGTKCRTTGEPLDAAPGA